MKTHKQWFIELNSKIRLIKIERMPIAAVFIVQIVICVKHLLPLRIEFVMHNVFPPLETNDNVLRVNCVQRR